MSPPLKEMLFDKAKNRFVSYIDRICLAGVSVIISVFLSFLEPSSLIDRIWPWPSIRSKVFSGIGKSCEQSINYPYLLWNIITAVIIAVVVYILFRIVTIWTRPLKNTDEEWRKKQEVEIKVIGNNDDGDEDDTSLKIVPKYSRVRILLRDCGLLVILGCLLFSIMRWQFIQGTTAELYGYYERMIYIIAPYAGEDNTILLRSRLCAVQSESDFKQLALFVSNITQNKTVIERSTSDGVKFPSPPKKIKAFISE